MRLPKTTMTEQSKAIFLSYTSQDAAAARKICGALRAAGLEVWFDESELRGGDAWDAAIRRQIKACALFVPIISGNSHARAEGYFRLEWKLAVDRSHLMASDRPFLLPVAIDTTDDAAARVPDKFRDVQWTRLPAGEPTAAFVAHVAKLLDGTASTASTRSPAPPPIDAPAPAPAPAYAPPARPAPIRGRPSFLTTAVVLGAVLLVGIGGWVLRHALTHVSKPVAYSPQDRRMTYAVLPFEAPAGDAQAAQVATAVGEAVNTELESDTLYAQVAPSRSVAEAVAKHTKLKELGRELDVHFLVRGNVSRTASGHAVDLFLIDAASERVLDKRTLKVPAGSLLPPWHDDIHFALRALTFAGMQQEVKIAAGEPVDSLDVRDLSFRGYVEWRKRRETDGKDAYGAASSLLNRARALAPDDPLAIYLTAGVNLCDCVNGWSHQVEEQIAIGTAAMEKYLLIDPHSVVMLSHKSDLYVLRGRYEDALLVADSILERNPTSGYGLISKAAALLKLGRPKDALATMNELATYTTLDYPGDLAQLAAIHYALGEYAEAAQLAKQATTKLSPQERANPVTGAVLLTLIAAEANLGHKERAIAATADFNAAVPGLKNVAAIKAWIRPNADLGGYEPLFTGLRLAGIPE
jgi:TolB-like protein